MEKYKILLEGAILVGICITNIGHILFVYTRFVLQTLQKGDLIFLGSVFLGLGLEPVSTVMSNGHA